MFCIIGKHYLFWLIIIVDILKDPCSGKFSLRDILAKMANKKECYQYLSLGKWQENGTRQTGEW